MLGLNFYLVFNRSISLEEQKASQFVIPSLPPKPVATSSQPSVFTSTIDTSGWQVYRNEAYGYEIKYPQGWEVKSDFADDDWPVEKSIMVSFFDAEKNIFSIRVFTEIKDIQGKLADLMAKKLDPLSSTITYERVEEKTINGNKIILGYENTAQVVAYLPRDSDLYIFSNIKIDVNMDNFLSTFSFNDIKKELQRRLPETIEWDCDGLYKDAICSVELDDNPSTKEYVKFYKPEAFERFGSTEVFQDNQHLAEGGMFIRIERDRMEGYHNILSFNRAGVCCYFISRLIWDTGFKHYKVDREWEQRYGTYWPVEYIR